ncbi:MULTISPECIES: carbohydrate ABC transporter permease [Stappiaceae]|jgi:multiple sugar transport system permease protein|uniref:carbohydrate ABC transporter permease n=1 Tax=Stappiaceae TaxID=2821832 RepID=UPI001269799D|nr:MULTISPECIES: carbohydrate ABC transporter permease [Stappiaceae]MCR9285221.1 carbohydrate ABC transporter permease [Paracoccaceae bacterium]MBN8184619.1 carbohydrate ABC transporter permease [Roseibium aggregatum]QFT01451.1 L-arabinose transport system permease protein AraQ [Labrenzia sp. THAF191b]QFT08158.1 L-arabinose transport system permease protein AraQ [Labrenzia sp. THAF191a]QFT19478.1 L-arabinose transport system permease protein AraQ [Labrenzia sp. THAF187b]
MKTRKLENWVLGIGSLLAAAIWIFPLYWAFITSIRTEERVVSEGAGVIPDEFNLASYIDVLFDTKLLNWYWNSIGTSVIITLVVIVSGMMCAYAISQMRFPGRRLLYGVVLASFMVPSQALVVTQFILMNDMGLINTWAGIILPQLIVPVVIIVYKQFFDAVPKEMREAVVLDGGGDYTLLFRIYLPLNWGITTALAIITFIMAWNQFLWPFLVITTENQMTIPVGITQVNDAFGVYYARLMSVALLGAMPVAVAYLIFQKKVTEAVMISSGVKG